ncbi:hypothetical protein LCGC14_2536630, partial [marine sediment metagenome]
AIEATEDGKFTRSMFGLPDKDPDVDPNYEGFAEIGQSLGYSLSTLVASAIGVAGGTAVGGPVGGAVGGFAAGGAVAFRASKDDYMDMVRDKISEEYEKLHDAPLTQEAWDEAYEQHEMAANKYGAWEAIPEAASNLIFMRMLAKPLKGASDAAAADFAKRVGATLISEQLTETATGFGQAGALAEHDLGEELTISEAFRQQAMQTLVVTGLLGGGSKVAQETTRAAKRKFMPARVLGRELNEAVDLANLDIRDDVGSRLLEPERAQLHAQKILDADNINDAIDETTKALDDVEDKITGADADVLPFIDRRKIVESAFEGGFSDDVGSDAFLRYLEEEHGVDARNDFLVGRQKWVDEWNGMVDELEPYNTLPELGPTKDPDVIRFPEKAAADTVDHEFTSTQVKLDDETSQAIKRVSTELIDAEDIYPDEGLEDRPHITVKYGLETDDSAEVSAILEGEGPVTATVTDIEIFTPEDEEYDVIVQRV